MSSSHCRASLDRRHAVNLHISHRLVLSANEVLLVEHRCVCVRVHGAHRLQSRLQDWTPLAVISNFSKKFYWNDISADKKKGFRLTYLRMYSAHAHNSTISSTQATARTSAGSRRILEQWMNDSSSPEGQWTLPSHQMDALTQALSSVHECWQSSANLNRVKSDGFAKLRGELTYQFPPRWAAFEKAPTKSRCTRWSRTCREGTRSIAPEMPRDVETLTCDTIRRWTLLSNAGRCSRTRVGKQWPWRLQNNWLW